MSCWNIYVGKPLTKSVNLSNLNDRYCFRAGLTFLVDMSPKKKSPTKTPQSPINVLQVPEDESSLDESIVDEDPDIDKTKKTIRIEDFLSEIEENREAVIEAVKAHVSGGIFSCKLSWN